MPRTFRRLARIDLARRRCVRCGFDAPQFERAGFDYFCPNCGQDLYARPPKSYLELEGFSGPVPDRARPPTRVGRLVRALGRIIGRARLGW